MEILLPAALLIILLVAFLFGKSAYRAWRSRTPYALVFAILIFVIALISITIITGIILFIAFPFER
jgi:hypothetical protein